MFICYINVTNGNIFQSKIFCHVSGALVTALWCRLKYVNNNQMDFYDILYRRSWSPEEET